MTASSSTNAAAKHADGAQDGASRTGDRARRSHRSPCAREQEQRQDRQPRRARRERRSPTRTPTRAGRRRPRGRAAKATATGRDPPERDAGLAEVRPAARPGRARSPPERAKPPSSRERRLADRPSAHERPRLLHEARGRAGLRAPSPPPTPRRGGPGRPACRRSLAPRGATSADRPPGRRSPRGARGARPRAGAGARATPRRRTRAPPTRTWPGGKDSASRARASTASGSAASEGLRRTRSRRASGAKSPSDRATSHATRAAARCAHTLPGAAAMLARSCRSACAKSPASSSACARWKSISAAWSPATSGSAAATRGDAPRSAVPPSSATAASPVRIGWKLPCASGVVHRSPARACSFAKRVQERLSRQADESPARGRTVPLAPALAPALAMALATASCRGCHDDHPYVPYAIGSGSPRRRHAGRCRRGHRGLVCARRGGSRQLCRRTGAGGASGAGPVDRGRHALWRRPTGSVFALAVVRDFDGDGSSDAFAIVRPADGNDPGRLVYYRGAPTSAPAAPGDLRSSRGARARRELHAARSPRGHRRAVGARRARSAVPHASVERAGALGRGHRCGGDAQGAPGRDDRRSRRRSGAQRSTPTPRTATATGGKTSRCA